MNVVNPKSGAKSGESKGECQICYTSGPLGKVQCGHKFCFDCWDSYITSKVEEGVPYVPCPTYKCNILIEDEMTMKLIKLPDIKKKYNILMAKSFVVVGIFNYFSYTIYTVKPR